MSHFFSDFDNKTRQREKMRAEIDSLLSNDATKVQDVFELDSTEKQDEIMGQLTVGGKNVMKFFTQRKRLSELIDYITVMPDSTCSKNRGHKYPFLAHHIFTEGGDGVTEIIDKFFFSYSNEDTVPNNQNTELLDQSNQPQSDASVIKIEGTDQPVKKNELENINGSASPPSVQPEEKNSINNQEQINTADTALIAASSAPIQQEQKPNKEENPSDDKNEQIINQGKSEIEISKNDDLDQDREDQEFEFEDALDQQFDDLTDEQTMPESEKLKLNFDQIIEQFENPKNTKKSFELRYQNDDDDDEIYIVNDGEEEDQDENDQNDLFMDPPSLSFNIIEDKDVQTKKEEQSPTNEFVDISKELEKSSKDLEEISKDDYNPFKDNLANSEKIPVTQKLEEVQIQEDYLGQSQDEVNISTFTQKLNEASVQKEKHDNLSKSELLPTTNTDEQNKQIEPAHQEKINARKRQKKQSLSIHQLDEATQKSINDTVEKERQRLTGVDEKDVIVAESDDKIQSEDDKESKPEKEIKKKVAFQIVEDHVKISPNTQKVESNNPFENDKLQQEINTNSDELNDRVEDDKDDDEFKDCTPYIDNEIVAPQNIIDDEEDNILRKIPLKVQTGAPPVKELIQVNLIKENQEELSPESPQSPSSPDMLITPKFKEQVSIELEQIVVQAKVEKKQDYSLINQFFSFLDIKTQKGSKKEYLNDTLSGYFCRVCLVIVSQEPKELMKYLEQTNYQIIDKLLDHLENKSISELVIKLLDEIIKQIDNYKEGVPPILQQQQNLAASVPNLKAEESQLQQSGQSSEKIEKDNKMEGHVIKIKGIIISILETKFGEETDYLEKINALEVFQELLKNKICYQTLTTKKSFEIITSFLVSDDADCKKNVYILLKYMIQNYEKHERFEKRINIDNFEDEELMTHSGSGSGILNKSKKSQGSKKKYQDVLKDIQESDLFQFIRVVVKEITSQEIETKFDLINSAKQSNQTLPLGMLFISIIEFIEKSSLIFNGFYNDINQTLIDQDIFNYIFEILEFYPNSDILNQTVTKIFQSIMRSKNDDVPEMLKYLLEETKLISFLIKNGPKCIMIDPKSLKDNSNLLIKSDNIATPSSPNQKEKKIIDGEQNKSKSPEQSSQVIEFPEEPSMDKSKQFKMQVPCKNSSGLQAHVKQISDILIDLGNISISAQDKSSKSKTDGVIKDKSHGQEQSGDQSKSSEIINETDDDQMLQQSISKVVSLNLNENSLWLSFVHHSINPINELQKGKLCQDNETSGFNSDNQIFDDDFIRSNLEEDNNNDDQFKGKNNALDKLSEEFDNIIGSLDNNKSEENSNNQGDSDEEDHQKFFKKMQECFSSNLNKRVGKSQNHVDNDEREMKQHAYQNIAEGINSQLRESLTDQHIDRFFPKSQGRERSSSSEFSNLLPPLSNDEDHKDEDGKNFYENYKTVRPYDKNQEDLTNIEDQEIQKISADPDVSAIATVDDDEEQFTALENKAMQSLTDDLQLDDVDINLDDSDEYDNINNRSSPNKTPDQNPDLKDFDDFAQNLEKVINEEVNRLSDQMGDQIGTDENAKKNKEIDEIKDIFDKIDDFDNMFGTLDNEIDNENKAEQQQQQKQETIISKSVFEPKLNNFMQESNNESIEIQQLAKSEYIQQQPNLMTINEDNVPEFQDNQFWKIVNPFDDELDIDKLIEDFNE